MTVRIGLGILTAQVPPGAQFAMADELATTVALAEAAERHGFDSCWLSEHHFAHDGYLPSVLPMLAALAVRTGRIGLGSAAILAPFHHPLRLAEDAAVVDQLSGGRLELGIAAGWRAAEFRAFGMRPAERGERLTETVAILRQAWSPEQVSFHGRYFTVDGVDVRPKPLRPIPIWIGAGADPAVARAGRLGDGYIASSAPLIEVARRFRLASTSAEPGRPYRLAVMLDVGFDEESRAAYRYKQEVYRRWHRDDERPVNWPLAPGGADRLLIKGSPMSIARRLQGFIRAAEGRDLTLIVRLHFPGMGHSAALAAVERFADDVLPRLRTLAAA